MNLRILKKLSKRAARLLPLLGDGREQFRADRWDNYTGLLIRCRKHYERMRSRHATRIREGEIKRPAADGKGFVAMWPPHHPRKGTVMVGAVSGYYEPEWDEETAWEALLNRVHDHFTDWGEESATPTRALPNPSAVFAAAAEILAELEAA
jgi:hypothetical protein